MTQGTTADERPDYVSEAKKPLQLHLAKLRQEVAAVEEILGRFDAMNGAPSSEIKLLPPVMPGEYKGQSRKDALEYYMRQRRGNRVPLSKIVADLLAGGCNAGEARKVGESPEATLAHNIKIGLSQPGARLYGRSPAGKLTRVDSRDILVWLDETAAEVPPAPRRRRKK
jgi:hypothetical protein